MNTRDNTHEEKRLCAKEHWCMGTYVNLPAINDVSCLLFRLWFTFP